jgi:hypothetical protein
MYIQIVSQGGKNNKIHDSPFCMVNAIYNANDVAFLKQLSGKINEKMYLNYKIQVYMIHCLQVLEQINTVTRMKGGTFVFVFTILPGIKLKLAVNKYRYKYSLTHF